MTVSVGIHVGHHASVAVVMGGELIAAIQQERITRRKHDGHETLHNEIPLLACLHAAGVSLGEVNFVTTSMQAAAPGGIGLHAPLVAPDFSLFDPYDSRHFALSHHLAHAICGFSTSSFDSAAVLVHDLSGSSTIDGRDYFLPFDKWAKDIKHSSGALPVISENLSIYRANRNGKFELFRRAFCVPHSQPASFVCSASSLYENVARFVFRKNDAYGQLMALAGLSLRSNDTELINIDDIVSFNDIGDLEFHNCWQNRADWKEDPLDNIALARVAQKAVERALLALATNAVRMTGQRYLVGSGGIFLNIPSNSAIATMGEIAGFHVPSAPHDAGIAIGCAYAPQFLGKSHEPISLPRISPPCDRLGPRYDLHRIGAAVTKVNHCVNISEAQILPGDAARKLLEGAIIARCSGRSEFGPRALGGRSLLASPLILENNNRLNKIKGRQPWRPVAPIVLKESLHEFFDGPLSPYMSFTHRVRDGHVGQLASLLHTDGTTRAQSLERDDDPWLYELLCEFGTLSGYPILLNTSLNGPDEPLVETPEDALAFFLVSHDVDFLLLNDHRVEKASVIAHECLPNILLGVKVHPEARFLLQIPKSEEGYRCILNGRSKQVSVTAFRTLYALPDIDAAVRILQQIGDEHLKDFVRELAALYLQDFIVRG